MFRYDEHTRKSTIHAKMRVFVLATFFAGSIFSLHMPSTVFAEVLPGGTTSGASALERVIGTAEVPAQSNLQATDTPTSSAPGSTPTSPKTEQAVGTPTSPVEGTAPPVTTAPTPETPAVTTPTTTPTDTAQTQAPTVSTQAEPTAVPDPAVGGRGAAEPLSPLGTVADEVVQDVSPTVEPETTAETNESNSPQFAGGATADSSDSDTLLEQISLSADTYFAPVDAETERTVVNPALNTRSSISPIRYTTSALSSEQTKQGYAVSLVTIIAGSALLASSRFRVGNSFLRRGSSATSVPQAAA
jgi:hypothetical protein